MHPIKTNKFARNYWLCMILIERLYEVYLVCIAEQGQEFSRRFVSVLDAVGPTYVTSLGVCGGRRLLPLKKPVVIVTAQHPTDNKTVECKLPFRQDFMTYFRDSGELIAKPSEHYAVLSPVQSPDESASTTIDRFNTAYPRRTVSCLDMELFSIFEVCRVRNLQEHDCYQTLPAIKAVSDHESKEERDHSKCEAALAAARHLPFLLSCVEKLHN